MITRNLALQNLERYIGHDLHQWALKFNIPTIKNGKQNKGWKGQTLERLAGLSSNNLQAPNGSGFELKSTAFYKKQGLWVPKETMAITMINSECLVVQPFYESHCWHKLKSILFCAVSWGGQHNMESKLISVETFDFLEEGELIAEIKDDYEYIRKKLILNDGDITKLTGRDGRWIQARTKGRGNGSTSRAFYAKRCLLIKLFDLSKVD